MRHAFHSYHVLRRHIDVLSKALQLRDGYTGAHCDRVIGIAAELGRACGLTGDQLGCLKVSAAVHDVGKIGIPDSILLKPGRLSDEERAIMQTHAVKGYEIIRTVEADGIDVVAQAVRHHHECYDGGGYPDQIAREAIPVCSRMLCIADGYDAMSSRRSYHRPKRHSEVLELIEQQEGLRYDPYLVRHFFRVIEHSEYKASDV